MGIPTLIGFGVGIILLLIGVCIWIFSEGPFSESCIPILERPSEYDISSAINSQVDIRKESAI